MHTWHWQTWQGLPYLTCSLLDDFSHGFFTQQCSPKTPEALVSALHPPAQVVRVKQVHGDAVLTPSEVKAALQALLDSAKAGSPAGLPADSSADLPTLPPADGLLTEQAGQAVWVCSADCVPALVADPETGQVAAVHAGWRGTAQEILPKAIARLLAQGSQLEKLQVALGPAIAGEVYQVSTTVAAEVGATILSQPPDPEATAEQIVAELKQLSESPVLDDPQPGRARLDVRQVNRLQLAKLGLTPEQIAIAPYCTYQQAEHFFSYRRDRLKKVQWSGIVSRG